jgi:hypothetical protein
MFSVGGLQMIGDFLSLRMRICASPRVSVSPHELQAAVHGKCWHNVGYAIAQFGGAYAYGWALNSVGPIALSGNQLPSLYSRWINHVVWRDQQNQLWEVTPHTDIMKAEQSWGTTIFVVDDNARFEVASQDACIPQPAVYIALRPEGEWTADCLSLAERAPRELQDGWLDRALHSIRRVGFSLANWRVERLNDRINDACLFA